MSTNQRVKACVILGAGASHDVHHVGSKLLDPTWQPPLVNELFRIERKPDYWDVAEPYQGARHLIQQLAALSSEVSIEDELRKLMEHRDPQTRENFKYIPMYLRDLLVKASYEYTSIPGSYSLLVQTLLADTDHEVLFLVLNYDNLLEQALTAYDPVSYQFGNTDEYVHASRKAKVVKLHGSIDWFIPIGPRNDTYEASLRSLDLSKALAEQTISVNQDPSLVTQVRLGPSSQFAYPALTAPLARKGTNDMVCPQSHLEMAREFLSDCRKFLVIGTSGLDADLLEFLERSSIPPSGLLHVVDNGHTLEVRSGFERGLPGLHGSGVNTFDDGFRSYTVSPMLVSFAKAGIR